MNGRSLWAGGAFLVALCTLSASAATTAIPPGETLTLKDDLILAGGDVLEIAGTAAKPCTVAGNNHQIKTKDNWTGHVKIAYCTFKQLGKEPPTAGGRVSGYFHALELTAGGNADVTIEHSTFDQSSSVEIVNQGKSTTVFRNNTVLDNALTPADKAVELSTFFFYASGSSPARKIFQANHIYKCACSFTNTSNWLIGGDADADGNILIGMRIGIFATECQGMVIKRNYLHCLLETSEKNPYWSQVATIFPSGDTSENVIRAGHWIVRMLRGDFHHNLVTEVHGHTHFQAGKGKIHHNIIAHRNPIPARLGDKALYTPGSFIMECYPADSLEIYNNTFDGTGCQLALGIDVQEGSVLPSLRNNVFYNIPQTVGPSWNEKVVEPHPERLNYADYNCFFSSTGKPDNYALGVKGKTERKDAGFGLNDLPKGGAKDQQVNPQFKGPLPDKFPFSDEDVKSGKVTVSQILKFYRDAYSPAPGSPLLGAGDPADGLGTDIGAVQVTPLKDKLPQQVSTK